MFAYHRPKAALQFKIIPPTVNEKGWLEKAGAVYIEGANGENKVYDWAKDKKVGFAISDNDLQLVYTAFSKYDGTKIQSLFDPAVKATMELRIVHDPGAGTDAKGDLTKTLSITTAPNPDSYWFNIQYSSGQKVSMGISSGELHKFRLFIEQNQNFILGEG